MIFHNLLKIRIRQLYRELAVIGLLRIVVLLVLLALGVTFAYQASSTKAYSYLIAGVQWTVITLIQWNRKDKRFLNILTDKVFTIYFLEYLLLSIPVITVLLIHLHFEGVALLIAGTIPVTFIKKTISKHNRNNWLIKKIPVACFEIKSGFRHQFFGIVAMLLIALGFSFWIGTIPVFLVILTAMFSGFFQECEPRNIVELNELPPRRFVHRKLFINLSFLLLTELPFVALFLVLHTEYWFIVVIEVVLSLLVSCFVILLKYAYYLPMAFLRANNILGALAISSFFIPFLIPVVIGMAVWYYFKSINNLALILDDYNQ